MFNQNKTMCCITIILLLIANGVGFSDSKLFSGSEISTGVINVTDNPVSAHKISLIYVVGVRG